jgi:hypothetical protein
VHPAVVGVLVGVRALTLLSLFSGGQAFWDTGPPGGLVIPVLPLVTARMASTATTTMTITIAAPAIHQPTGDFFFWICW